MDKGASRKTPLFDWHTDHDANMGHFGGYLMPMWYPDGVKTEHLAVLTQAGIFDTSHMALLLVQGRDSLDLLQHCFTNDLNATGPRKDTPLMPGRCIYGAFHGSR
jgi:aminomethyltransferase